MAEIGKVVMIVGFDSREQESRVSSMSSSRGVGVGVEVEPLVFVVDLPHEVLRCMSVLHTSKKSAKPRYRYRICIE